MTKHDLDYEFDFEKEYNFDPNAEAEDDFDLDALMAENFGEEESQPLDDILHQQDESDSEEELHFDQEFDPAFDGEFDEGLTSDFDFDFDGEMGMHSEPAPVEEQKDASDFDFDRDFKPMTEKQKEFELDPELQRELGLTEEAEPPVQQETPAPEQTQEPQHSEPGRPHQQRRKRPHGRRPRNKAREFKDVMLPRIIAGVAALLIVSFVISAIVYAVQGHKLKKQERLEAEASAQSEAARLEQEVKTLLDEAAKLAAGYDYDAAIQKLDSFTGEKDKYTELQRMRAEYVQTQSQLKAVEDPSKIANLSFHMLIADPARAFADKKYGKSYNMNFVTTDEFSKILDQLYENNYVLVNFNSFVEEVVGEDGHVSYKSKPIYLPDGKKPVMLTETMVNYFGYMIDSDKDGVPDKGGAGFASRLVVDEYGEVKAEMVDAEGNTVVGNYDLVPILNDFIKEHPDFSYRGAKATLAVTGNEGVFGYRTNKEAKSKVSESYYEEQVAGAQKLVEALRNSGYKIASYSYGNKSYGKDASAANIKEDLQHWSDEVTPVLGNVDVLVYAKGSDIAGAGAYSGSKYDVLRDAGFHYFIGSGSTPTTEITDKYVRQQRLMVSGNQMAYSSSRFIDFFASKTILNEQRGTVPEK